MLAPNRGGKRENKEGRRERGRREVGKGGSRRVGVGREKEGEKERFSFEASVFPT